MNAVSLTSSFPATVQPGIPKLGETPTGWTRAPLGQYLKEVRRPIKMADDEIYKLVTVKRARGGVVDRGSFLGRDVLVKSQFEIEAGDFLISKRQIVHGACGLVPKKLAGSIVSNEYAVLNGSDGIDTTFLNYLAHSIFFQQTCFHSSIGVHVEKMIFKLDRWLKFDFNLPPLPEQRKIADILSTWDAAIEKTEALLATAKAQKRALMQSLLTGKHRFPEFTGQPWKEVRLGDVARIYDGTHATPKYVEHGVPFYSVEHLTKDQFSNTKYISEDVFEKENKRVKLERSDILMSRIGDVGTTRLIDWDVRASFYVSLALIKSVEDVSSEYLAQYMNSQDFQAELWKRMIHVAFPKKINLGEIGNCVVKLPSRKEQVRIAKALGDLDMEITCSKSEVTKLRSEKKALMQQLLTGKRRVSV